MILGAHHRQHTRKAHNPFREPQQEIASMSMSLRPSLFTLTFSKSSPLTHTPIRVEQFRQLLVHHPSRPLIESVCHGLSQILRTLDFSHLELSSNDQPPPESRQGIHHFLAVPKKGSSKLQLVNDHSTGMNIHAIMAQNGGQRLSSIPSFAHASSLASPSDDFKRR